MSTTMSMYGAARTGQLSVCLSVCLTAGDREEETTKEIGDSPFSPSFFRWHSAKTRFTSRPSPMTFRDEQRAER